MFRTGLPIRRRDLWMTAGLVAFATAEGLSLHRHRGAGTVLFALMAASLAVCRKWPLMPAVVVGALMPTLTATGLSLNAGVSLTLVVVVASYAPGAYLPLRSGLLTLAVLVAGGATAVLLDSRPVVSNLAYMLVLAGVPFAFGTAMQARQRYVAVLEERSALLEREKESRAEAAVVEERARIARELHDIVSHSLSAISLQAGGVRRLLTSEQDKQRQALEAVEHTARGAIEEMHHMLGLLRSHGGSDELSPQPGLAQLPDLVGQASASGLTVHTSVSGTERPLSSGIELAAYRTVQEALTNITRHSDATEAAISLGYGPSGLRIEVTDRGRPTGRGGGAGMGLLGMRERVALYGGSFAAGPLADGGFRVSIELPYPVEVP